VTESPIASLEGIELRYFATLSAVAEECSFRGAARRLGYAPSAVSAQITALERLLGAQLVDRKARASGATLTDAGRLLASHADSIIAELHSLRRELEALREGGGSPLEVGISEPIGARVLARLASAYRRNGSSVCLRPREFTRDADSYLALSRGEVELAILSAPRPKSGFGALELPREHFLLAAPRSWSLSGEVALAELALLPLIGANSSSARAQVERHLRSREAELTIVARADNESTIRALIAEGFGAAFVPESARMDDGEIVSLELAALDSLYHTPAIVWNESRKKSLPAAALLEAARELGLSAELLRKTTRPIPHP